MQIIKLTNTELYFLRYLVSTHQLSDFDEIKEAKTLEKLRIKLGVK